MVLKYFFRSSFSKTKPPLFLRNPHVWPNIGNNVVVPEAGGSITDIPKPFSMEAETNTCGLLSDLVRTIGVPGVISPRPGDSDVKDCFEISEKN